jgi:hypothetical protein
VICFAVDQSLKYQRYLLGVIASLRRSNPSSDHVVRVYEVGAGKDFVSRLTAAGCEVRSAPRTVPLKDQSHFPCSAAKCLALADTENDDVILTFDVDGLILSSLEPLIEEFLASDCDVAMLPEVDRRGNASPVRECWFDCPVGEFNDANEWMNKPILNCGMIVSRGASARWMGSSALRLVTQYERCLYLGEQGPINGLVYDSNCKVLLLTPRHHCIFISEDGLTFAEGAHPYLSGVLVDGKQVIYRHFGNRHVKNYQVALDHLLNFGD